MHPRCMSGDAEAKKQDVSYSEGDVIQELLATHTLPKRGRNPAVNGVTTLHGSISLKEHGQIIYSHMDDISHGITCEGISAI